jgi:predicted nucleotidyltransferase
MLRTEIIDTLKTFKVEYAPRYGILSLGLFGSMARGDSTEASDVDIIIETDVPDPFTIASIKDDLEKRLHHRVDIVRLRNGMNPALRRRIDTEAVYV